MHENRETSAMTERGNKGSPASKGESRTAGMHVDEESDCVVVPVKRPNNEREQLAREAEAVEGSTQSKENISEIHTPPTQSGNRVSQGLAGVRQVARERKQLHILIRAYALTPNIQARSRMR